MLLAAILTIGWAGWRIVSFFTVPGPSARHLDRTEEIGKLSADLIATALDGKPWFGLWLDPKADPALRRQTQAFQAQLKTHAPMLGELIVGQGGRAEHMRLYESGIPVDTFQQAIESCPEGAVLVSLAGFPEAKASEFSNWKPGAPSLLVGLSFRIPLPAADLIRSGHIRGAILPVADLPIDPGLAQLPANEWFSRCRTWIDSVTIDEWEASLP